MRSGGLTDGTWRFGDPVTITGVTSTNGPLTVLFVCTANICRSAYAHRRAEQMVGGGARVISAGTHAREGQPMDLLMADEITRRGGNPGGFTSRPLTLEQAKTADLILTAEAAHRSWILEDWPYLLARTFTIGQFASQLDRVTSETGADVIDEVHALRSRASGNDDVADPYRRGPEAAAACAKQVDTLLSVVLPRLVP